MPSLDTLSTEILIKIFEYLDIRDLVILKRTCRRFDDVIETWAHKFFCNAALLVTNQTHRTVANRSFRALSRFEKYRISRNWCQGTYREESLLFSAVKFIPWLQLEKDCLWLSRGADVLAYRRHSRGIRTRQPVYRLRGKTKGDVCRFILKHNQILCGQTDGSMWLWSLNKKRFIFNKTDCHESDINQVDLNKDIMVSGSRDGCVKTWSRNNRHDFGCASIALDDRVWALSLSEEDKSLLAIGTAGTSTVNPSTPPLTLKICDVKNQTIISQLGTRRIGAGILDIKWENSSVLWTCGYDAYLRRWDLRTGECEQVFEDPCESTVYCFQYDHVNTIMSGTQGDGRVVLWDTRQKHYVQMYFMDCCRRRDKSSPVYGLSFDAEFLFAVTDQHVSVLDFSGHNGRSRDYSNLFLKQIRV